MGWLLCFPVILLFSVSSCPDRNKDISLHLCNDTFFHVRKGTVSLAGCSGSYRVNLVGGSLDSLSTCFSIMFLPLRFPFALWCSGQNNGKNRRGEWKGPWPGWASLLTIVITNFICSVLLPLWSETLTDKNRLFSAEGCCLFLRMAQDGSQLSWWTGRENTLCVGQCVKHQSCANLLHPHDSVVAYITRLTICAYVCDVGVCMCVCMHRQGCVNGTHKTTRNTVPQVLWKFLFFEIESLIGLGFTN